MITWSEGRT